MTEIENIIYPKLRYSQIKFITSTQNIGCTACYKLCYTSIFNASYSIKHFAAITLTLMMTKL